MNAPAPAPQLRYGICRNCSAAGLGWAGLACCEVVMWVETGALKPPVPGAGAHCPHLLQTPPPRPGTIQLQPGGRGVVGDDEAENVAD